MYNIYHIPEFVYSDGSIGKIGVTSQKLKIRMKANKRISVEGFTKWEVLEEHTDVYEVSDREQQLQKEYGYKVDTLPYWKTIKMSAKGGKVSIQSLLANNDINKWRSKGANSQVKSGMLAEKRKKAHIASSKAILQYDLDGNFIKEYPSTSAASREIGLNTINILSVLKNKWKQTKGYTFKYKE